MKLSDKILMGFLALMIAGALGLIIALWAATTIPAKQVLNIENIKTNSLMYQEEAFTGIAVSGGWKIKIIRADSHSVTVTRNDSGDIRVKVVAENGTLTLISSDLSLTGKHVTATITCPRLMTLSTSGAIEATVVGFSEDSFTVTSTGGSQIKAQKCTVKHLKLTLGGVSEVNTRESVVSQAEVRTTGAFHVILDLDRGTLSGSAGGIGGIEVFGKVDHNTLRTTGLVEITYHE